MSIRLTTALAVSLCAGAAMASSPQQVTGYAGHASLDANGNVLSGNQTRLDMRYSNTNSSGWGYSHGDTLIMDDLNMIGGGDTLDELTFSIVNFGASSLTSIDVNFMFAGDPALDGPGDDLPGVSFSTTLDLVAIFGGTGLDGGFGGYISLTGLAGSAIVLPEDPLNFMWAGLSYGNAVGGDLADIGQLLTEPATIGSTDDLFYNDGTGNLSWFGGGVVGVNPFGNFGWEIGTVPTPGAFALIGLGGLVATRRRR